jgi:hypothetical protein
VAEPQVPRPDAPTTVATMGSHNEPNDAKAFFLEVAELLDLPANERRRLGAGVPFTGPGDLICRFQLVRLEGRLHARPEVILPLVESDIRRIDANQLLAVQQALLAEMQWVLGPSAEGLLQACPSAWVTRPEEAARQLDLGVSLADLALELLGPAPQAPKAGPTTQ